MGANRWMVCVALLGLLPAGIVRAQTPQEKKRGDILKDLGLKKKPPAPPPEATPAPPAGEAPAEGAEKAEPSGAAAAGKQKGANKSPPTAGLAAPSFGRVVHPLFVSTCKACHAPGAPGGASRLLLSGDAAADHHAVARFVNTRDPEASVLLGKVSGATLHAGGAPWPATGAQYQRVLAWIRGGARLDATAKPEPVAEAPGAAPRVPPSRRPPATSTAPGSAPAAPVAVPPAAGEPTPAAPAATGAAGPHPDPLPQAGEGERSAGSSAPRFAATVHPVLMSACATCHRAGAPAGMTRLVLSGDAAQDEAIVRPFVDAQAPQQSVLVTKSAGQMHAGGAVLPAGDPRLEAIVAWTKGLAAAEASATEAAAASTPAAAAPAAAPSIAPAPAGGYAAPPGPHGHGGPGGPGLGLPLGFMLNGRFDLAYERRQFSGGPFETASVNALRSYHHFLFLSHDRAVDPCGLSVEVLTLQFWEAHCRVPGLPAPLRLTVAGGKIVVPFGADPLYHQNYGGLGGFDQPVLPVIWAVEGAAAHLLVAHREFVLTDDLFVVRGFALPKADSIINLQSGFSPDDAVELGWGNRLGVAWRFVSAWYSAYYNPLGFGRRLFMQAVDLTIARPRGIPVLQHFSLGAGVLRADVSGGGPGVGGVGLDYYNFADYLQLRYYPTDWLYVQYRTGLRTINNRRGVVLDKTRLTNADASTHNFAVVGRYRGLTGGLYYFINLEKVDEIPNDLLRLIVTYEF